jgi:molecular chaperone GrpE
MAKMNEDAKAADQQPVENAEVSLEGKDAAELRAMLESAWAEATQQRASAEEFRNLALREHADYLNYKRRVESERVSQAEAVRAETILAFLPVVDDLERALGHIPASVAKEGWAQGFGLIERNLVAAFERLGLRRLGSEGEEFDPNIHEAVAYEDHPTLAEGHVAAVLRPGYQLGERVVRAAQVTVSRAAGGTGVQDDSWPAHEAQPGRANGEVDRADLQQPRNIERS